MDLKKIGKFIAKKRQAKGFTQETLAEALDISNRSVSKWERGICLPDAKNMSNLCKTLGITYNELLNGTDASQHDANLSADQTVACVITYAEKQLTRLRRISAGILISLGIIIIIAAASIFQSGTHVSMYAPIFGVLMVLIGSAFLLRNQPYKKRLLAYLGIFALLTSMFLGFDFLNVKLNNVPPRFTYKIITTSNLIYYDTPFYDVIRCNPDESTETWQITPNKHLTSEQITDLNHYL